MPKLPDAARKKTTEWRLTMCVTATAKRRRRQAKSGWKNMRPQDRPIYASHSAETYDKRLARLREKQQMMQMRARRKGKK